MIKACYSTSLKAIPVFTHLTLTKMCKVATIIISIRGTE